jgi:hypothetical protein
MAVGSRRAHFYFQLDTGQLMPPTPGCGTVAAKVTMRLDQTAADNVFNPHGQCPLCE